MPEKETEHTASSAGTAAPQQQTDRICPNCGAVHTEQELARAEYRCACGLELAYVETTPAGIARGVLGWLHRPGEVVLERYRIEKVLGKGGFAATYLVEDLRLNGKKRALKEIPEPLYDETETEMLSHLSHPSIPDIIDRARVSGMVYLVLEFGGGRTLENERRSRGGRIPLDTLLPWLRQLGGVIGYLHNQDPPIIHRDLKPDNVLLDEHDRIMLIDFGIAKQSADSGVTRTIARAATKGYSPPEQALGTGTDPRSDVYALAATAYNLLTGQVPPPAHERVAGTELIPPAQLVPGIPTHISDTLIQALNLNINRRPASVEQLLEPLGATASPPTSFTPNTSQTVRVGDLPLEYTEKAASVRIHSERVTVAPTTSHQRRSRRGLWVFASLMVMVASAGGLWLFQEPILKQLFPEEQKTTDSGKETTPSQAPETAQQPAGSVTPKEMPDMQRPVATQPLTSASLETATKEAATALPAPVPATAQSSTLQPATQWPTAAAGSVHTSQFQPTVVPGTLSKPVPTAQSQVAKSSAMSAFESRRSEALKEISTTQESKESSTSRESVEETVAKRQPISPPKPPSTPKKVKSTPVKRHDSKKKPAKNQASSGWSATYIGTKSTD